jgi:hypothetical protein
MFIDQKPLTHSTTNQKRSYRIMQTNLINTFKIGSIALLWGLIIFLCLSSISYADNTAIIAEIDKVVGAKSWIQKMFAVGALVAGLLVIFVQKHIALGVGIIAVVWAALGVYNSGVLF